MKPIIFNTEMVRTILDGRKTQTRRVVQYQPIDILPMKVPDMWVTLDTENPNHGKVIKCRFGIPGDKLWVREIFRWADNLVDGYERDSAYFIQFKVDGHVHHICADGKLGSEYDDVSPELKGSWSTDKEYGKWKPPMHLPRNLSRITLQIKDVRVERVQDISESDSKAEGVLEAEQCDHIRQTCEDIGCYGNGYKATFTSLWDSINEKRGYGWDTNPWVWVVEFKKI